MLDDVDIEDLLQKLINMVDNTKHLNDEFNVKDYSSKKHIFAKHIELLETFTQVEANILNYISSINSLGEAKKQDLQLSILKKLKENYKIAVNDSLFIKALEKDISNEYSIFESVFNKEFKHLKEFYGLDLIYLKLDPNNIQANNKLQEELKVVENDLYLSFEQRVNKRLRVRKTPLFLLFSYKSFLSEKIMIDWESNYEIPVKRIKLHNDPTYIFLTKKFRELIDDRFNLFDEKVFSAEERFLFFEIMLLSNLEYIRDSDYTKQVLYNNSKKYFYLFGINDKNVEIMEMYSVYFDKFRDPEKELFIEVNRKDSSDRAVNNDNKKNDGDNLKSTINSNKKKGLFGKIVSSVKSNISNIGSTITGKSLKDKINNSNTIKKRHINEHPLISESNKNSQVLNDQYIERPSLVKELLLVKMAQLEECLNSQEDFSLIKKTFLHEKFILLIFSYSLIFNNLMTYHLLTPDELEHQDVKVKVTSNINEINDLNKSKKTFRIVFQSELKVSSRERQFLTNTLKNFDIFLKKPIEFKALDINNLLEHYIFNSLIKSYAKYLFDENNSKKLTFEKEDLLNKIYETPQTNDEPDYEAHMMDLKKLQNDFYKFTDTEVSFTKEDNTVVLKLANSVKSVLSFIGGKFGLSTNKSKATVIDIKELKLIPYESLSTSTHIYIFIGGMFVGNKSINNSWKKLFPVNKTVDMYNLHWQSEHLFGLGFYLLDLLPKSYNINNSDISSINVKRDISFLKDSLQNNILLMIKEKEVSVKNTQISAIYGKILAYFLACRNVFNFHTISLIGYSLGANVVKYCLKELHLIGEYNMDVYNLIQNVVFISGATTIDAEENIDNQINNKTTEIKENWKDVLEMVGGNIYNVYSEKDYVLGIPYREFFGESPIGIKPISILNERKTNIVKNVNFTSMNLNHFDYPSYFDKIADELNLE